jgi:hypothetical protein
MTALARQFGKDPGSVFVEIIRVSPKPIPAQDIKRELIDAGVKKVDIDRHWTRTQRMIKLHPQITMETKRYAWLAERRSAESSLDMLISHMPARMPAWLKDSWAQNVADALARAGATDAGWAEHQFQQARLVADLAVAVESLRARGGAIAEVAKLLAEEARRKRLWQLGEPGDTVAFDPATHEAEAETPDPGTVVQVTRSGYVWRGGGEPIVAAKAIVAV